MRIRKKKPVAQPSAPEPKPAHGKTQDPAPAHDEASTYKDLRSSVFGKLMRKGTAEEAAAQAAALEVLDNAKKAAKQKKAAGRRPLNIFRKAIPGHKRKDLTQTQRKKLLAFYLEKSGAPWTEDMLRSRINALCIIVPIVLSLYWLYQALFGTLSWAGMLLFIIISIVVGYFGAWVAGWGIIYLYLDFRLYRRRREIEEILPDFLQLVSSNISAGMPIDRALWFAIRPKFGVLAKEMETVAKSVMTGQDLKMALSDFSDKYDSVQLRRSVNLIGEGLDAGGEMADLLNKIALNFEEIKVMRKDMASSVTTYVIFITFASVVAAPFLFSLATELLIIIQTLTSQMDLSSSSASFLSVAPNAIAIDDFRVFAVSMIVISSLVSAMLVSTISRGTIRDGLKYIPMFMGAALVLYFAASWLLHAAFGGLFALS